MKTRSQKPFPDYITIGINLRPAKKQELIALIRQHGMERLFEPYMLKLSPADEEELAIPFDAAEFLYDQHKQSIFAQAQLPDGTTELFRLGDRDEVFTVLMKLLERKRDYCMSAVRYGAPLNAHRYTEIVKGKVQSEYLDLLTASRASIIKLLQITRGNAETSDEKVLRSVEKNLEPFKKRFSDFKASFSSSIKDPKAYEELVEFQKRRNEGKPPRTTIVNERQNNFYGPTAYNETGDNKNFSQNQTTGSQMQDVDLKTLAEQLNKLLANARDKAKSGDQFKDLAAVAEAEEAAKNGDRNKTFEKLKTVSKWAFDVAREVGVELAAKVISIQIGGA